MIERRKSISEYWTPEARLAVAKEMMCPIVVNLRSYFDGEARHASTVALAWC